MSATLHLGLNVKNSKSKERIEKKDIRHKSSDEYFINSEHRVIK